MSDSCSLKYNTSETLEMKKVSFGLAFILAALSGASISGVSISRDSINEAALNTKSLISSELVQDVRAEAISNPIKRLNKFNERAQQMLLNAERKFDIANNQVDRLRFMKFQQHVEKAIFFNNASVKALAEQEFDYANSLLQLPKYSGMPGRV